MSHIFLSYSHQDAREAAEYLYTRLTGAGYQVWKDDHSLEPGTNFPKEIFNAVSQHHYLINLISTGSVNSKWVEDEIGTAKALEKHIIPILIEDIPIPTFLVNIQRLEMKNGTQNWQVLNKLVNSLEGGESIPRVYNMSGHKDFEINGILLLDHCDFGYVDLSNPAAITEIAQKLGASAIPYIQSGAGIVPHGHPTVASAILAYLSGAITFMPKLYYTYRSSDVKFCIDAKTFISPQNIREIGFKDRSNNKV